MPTTEEIIIVVIEDDHEDTRPIADLAFEAQEKIDAGILRPGCCDRLTQALLSAGYCELRP